MRERLASVVIGLSIVSACGGSPSAPTTPVPQPTAAAPASTTPWPLSGTVRDGEGRPVPDVRLEFRAVGSAGTPVSTVTDASGAYRVTLDAAPALGVFAASAMMDKAGYERSRVDIRTSAAPAVVQDLRLHPILRIAAGESTHVVVAPDDAICGMWSEWTCRTVRVTSPGAGTITIEAVPDGGGPPAAGLEFYAPPRDGYETRQTVRVWPGLEVKVGVAIASASRAGYTVKTSFASGD
jgi:hypothetical protein